MNFQLIAGAIYQAVEIYRAAVSVCKWRVIGLENKWTSRRREDGWKEGQTELGSTESGILGSHSPRVEEKSVS